MLRLAIFFVTIGLAQWSFAEGIYRSQDASGHVTYSDTPQANSTEVNIEGEQDSSKPSADDVDGEDLKNAKDQDTKKANQEQKARLEQRLKQYDFSLNQTTNYLKDAERNLTRATELCRKIDPGSDSYNKCLADKQKASDTVEAARSQLENLKQQISSDRQELKKLQSTLENE